MGKKIACYISGHGFGHAVRSAALLMELALLKPDWRFFINSGAPAFLFERLLALPNTFFRKVSIDFGLFQLDPRTIDFEKTAENLEGLVAGYGQIVDREVTFLKRENMDAVFCDIPFLPFGAAARCKLPSIGMGNFTWDWIYYYYKERHPVFEQAARLAFKCYHHCSLYLELPFSPPHKAFRNVLPIPLVCRRPELPPNEVRQRLGSENGQKLLLIGFSDLNLSTTVSEKLEVVNGVSFITPSPLELNIKNGIPVDVAEIDFPSLVGACDGIITKAGYGIVTDAIVAGVPLITTDRDDFPELPFLNRLIDQTVGQQFINRKDFEAGRWGKSIKALKKKEYTIKTNGVEVGAQSIISFLK